MHDFDLTRKTLLKWSKELGLAEDLQLCIEPEFHSKAQGHRLKIREKLKEQIDDPKEIENLKLDDLNSIPIGQSLDVSISHCPKAGGFALTREKNIGFDMEVSSRIRDEILLRITSQELFDLAPGHGQLWAATEASYKAMKGEKQPNTVMVVEVRDWKQLEEGTYSYSFSCSRDESLSGIGLVTEQDDMAVAISFL